MSKAQVTFPSAADTSAIDIQDAGVLIVSNPGTMNFTGAGVTVTESPTGTAQVDIPGFSLEVQDAGTPIVSNPGTMNFTGAGVTVTESPAGTAAVDIPDASVKFWTESETATTQQNTRWIPNNVAADVTAVVQPKGTGANTAQRPDGTTTGGNARGNYATDWQKQRTNANQVASGTESTISGGHNNRASATNSTIGGGQGNLASSTGSTIGGGQGNTADNQYAVVGGGLNNTAGGGSNNGAVVAGGELNNAVADYTFATGRQNSVTSAESFASGRLSAASATASSAFGRSANSYIGGMLSTRGFATAGQISLFPSANFSQLYASGATIVVTIGFPATARTLWNGMIKFSTQVDQIIGTATGITLGDLFCTSDLIVVKRTGGATTIVGTPTNLQTTSDASFATASVVYSISGNNLIATFTMPTFSGGGTLYMDGGCALFLHDQI
jgi:hypothetical protein